MYCLLTCVAVRCKTERWRQKGTRRESIRDIYPAGEQKKPNQS